MKGERVGTKKLRKSAIPLGSQFTPDLVDLRAFLQAIVENSGNKASIAAGVWAKNVRLKDKEKPPTKRNFNLPVEAAVSYGLIDKGTYSATPVTERLAKLEGAELYDEFARHILLNLNGLRVLDAIRQMDIENGERSITGDSLAEYLTSQGFNVTVHNTAINSLRMWLAWAGLFENRGKGRGCWRINGSQYTRLVGLDEETATVLAGLAAHQLAFIDALCAIGPRTKYVASEVRELARARSPGVRFSSNSLPKDVLEPLKVAGLIDYEAKGTEGGKSSTLTTTPLFESELLQPFVTIGVRQLDAAISGYFRKRPEDIFAELQSDEDSVKGRALEALAIRVMRLLGLRFVAWNNRAKNTGWAEVDAVVAGVFGAAPTRWQIQCKNTPGSRRVDLEDVAKEVGLVPITRATHILFLANNDFTSEAHKYAEQVMYSSAVTIFLLGKREFDELRKDDTTLGRILRVKADEIVKRAPATSVFHWK